MCIHTKTLSDLLAIGTVTLWHWPVRCDMVKRRSRMSGKSPGAIMRCALVLAAFATGCAGQSPTQPTALAQPTAFVLAGPTGEPKAVTAASTLSANAGTAHAVIPQDFNLSSACFGESVHVTGEVYEVIKFQETGNGLLTMVHHNPAGVRGVGLLSGATYHGTGVGQGVTFGDEDFTFVLSFNMIGEGSARNFTVHQTIHMTTTANGEVTADVLNVKMNCH
jgi:hypothetical protein